MCHITCPNCGTRDHTSGFGLAAGPMGAYTFCDNCDRLLEFTLDSSYDEEEQATGYAKLDQHMISAFGAENWNSQEHRLVDKWYNQEPINGNA